MLPSDNPHQQLSSAEVIHDWPGRLAEGNIGNLGTVLYCALEAYAIRELGVIGISVDRSIHNERDFLGNLLILLPIGAQADHNLGSARIIEILHHEFTSWWSSISLLQMNHGIKLMIGNVVLLIVLL